MASYGAMTRCHASSFSLRFLRVRLLRFAPALLYQHSPLLRRQAVLVDASLDLHFASFDRGGCAGAQVGVRVPKSAPQSAYGSLVAQLGLLRSFHVPEVGFDHGHALAQPLGLDRCAHRDQHDDQDETRQRVIDLPPLDRKYRPAPETGARGASCRGCLTSLGTAPRNDGIRSSAWQRDAPHRQPQAPPPRQHRSSKPARIPSILRQRSSCPSNSSQPPARRTEDKIKVFYTLF